MAITRTLSFFKREEVIPVYMSYALSMESLTEPVADRQLPTKFMTIIILLSLIIGQIWGRSIPIKTAGLQPVLKPLEFDSNEVMPRIGINKFLSELPVVIIFSTPLLATPEEDTPPEAVPIEWVEGMLVPENHASEAERVALAIVLEGEGGGLESLTELSWIGWIIINRILSDKCPCNDIIGVITQEGQFDGYKEGGHYSERSYWMANDILARYEAELAGESEVGRTIPQKFLFFYGDGKHNYFSVTPGGSHYNGELDSPYAT